MSRPGDERDPMTLAPTRMDERHEAVADSTLTVTTYSTTWPASDVERTVGTPQKPGTGARLAVRKFGAAINKLAG